MADTGQTFIVSTSLSPLYLNEPIAIPIRTFQQPPLPSNSFDPDIHPQHASFSTILTTFSHGTIVLRLLCSDSVVELMSLSSQVIPIRFVFPVPLLPKVGLFPMRPNTLHVLAVTTTGSLYRLIVPLDEVDEASLRRNQGDGPHYQEYVIANFPEVQKPLVNIEGIDSVTIALPDGFLLRLQSDSALSGEDWSETILHHGSLLTSLSSLFSMNSGPANDIVSMASHPWPTDIGDVWTLSRDWTLRLWKAHLGCTASKTINHHHPSNTGSSTSVAKQPLLDSSLQSLIRVFSLNERVYVLVFIPSTSATSGGIFHLFDTHGDYLHDILAFECSRNTVQSYLQDFSVHGKSLYTLWERQGRSAVESTQLPLDGRENGEFQPRWVVANYVNEPDLTPAYIEEKLLTPGSLTSKYFEALLKPGVFSFQTLKTALHQYINSCSSMSPIAPPLLTSTYKNVEEQLANIVGRMVNLNRDPQTGALQYAAYWIALKRDWEGLIARCREIERSARWPLALGINNQGIVIIEREHVGFLVAEDASIRLQRYALYTPIDLNSRYDILPIMSKLRSEVGPRIVSTVKDCIVDILHQEISFDCSDIFQDQARRVGIRESLTEASLEWFTRRLHGVGDLEADVGGVIHAISRFDSDVKLGEANDPGTPLIVESSSLSIELATAYLVSVISARYDLCLSLFTLLFFIADDLSTWSPTILGELLAIFRGISMLRQTVSQPIGSYDGQDTEQADSEDVVRRMQNLNLSNIGLTYRTSLIRSFLPQSSNSHFSVVAHCFLDSVGLLQSVSPSNVTTHEVLFCEKVRLLGLLDVARDLLAWLPRTPATTFVLATIWLQLGRPADSAILLEKLASSFGSDCPLTQEDHEALVLVMPSSETLESAYAFYIHVSEMFKKHSLVYYEVLFAQLAISSAPLDVDISSLWSTVIKGYTDLGRYDDAYAAFIATPFNEQKRECLSHLVLQMCENNAIELFMSFPFVGVVKEVEIALLSRIEELEPDSRHSYANILYSWYFRRGNYRDGALVMYQQSEQLTSAVNDSKSFTRAELSLEAMMIAINALSMLASNNAWIIVPKSLDRSRSVSVDYASEDDSSPQKFDSNIVHLSDMQNKCLLLRARIELVRKDPSLSFPEAHFLPPTMVVMRLASLTFFEDALTTARALKVDMTDIFAEMTAQCLRLTSKADGFVYQEQGDWLLTDQLAPCPPVERGWNYIRQSLERHDSADIDYRYSKVVIESLLVHDQDSVAPAWLLRTLTKHQPEYLVRTYLTYGRVDLALDHSLSMIQQDKVALMRGTLKTAGATWLPYNLFDQVLAAAAQAEESKSLPRLAELRTELDVRVQRLQKLSH